MVFFDQSGRFNDVGTVNSVNDLLGRNVVGDQTIGIDYDMKLTRLSAGNSHRGDARQTSQPRTNDVVGDVVQAALVACV